MALEFLKELMIYYLKVFSKIGKNYFCAFHGWGPNVEHGQDLSMIFKVIFQGFFGKKVFRHILGVLLGV